MNIDIRKIYKRFDVPLQLVVEQLLSTNLMDDHIDVWKKYILEVELIQDNNELDFHFEIFGSTLNDYPFPSYKDNEYNKISAINPFAATAMMVAYENREL